MLNVTNKSSTIRPEMCIKKVKRVKVDFKVVIFFNEDSAKMEE